MLRVRTTVAALAVTALAGCPHDPDAEICPPVGAGDLVITELRGEQAGGDTWGQWIEVFNAGSATSLEGAVLDIRSLDGATDMRLLVREPVELAAGAYLVLGPDALDHVDVALPGDFADDLPGAGVVTLRACGAVIDEVRWNSLPDMGTRALDGGGAPSAEANDDAAAWCTDTTPSDDTTMLGLPGSPGAGNPPCAI